jgi:hypothetical protein
MLSFLMFACTACPGPVGEPRPPFFGFTGTIPTRSERTKLHSRRAARCLYFDHRHEKLLAISPLFATLTSTPQIAENTSTLSPFLATHTDLSPVSPVFATHTKTTGVGVSLTKDFRYYLKSASPGRTFCSLFSLFEQRAFDNLFEIKGLRTLSENRRGGMGISNKNLQELLEGSSHFGIRHSPRITRHFIQVLSFHTLPNTFALTKNSTLFFSCNSELFRKNTRAWGRGYLPQAKSFSITSSPGPSPYEICLREAQSGTKMHPISSLWRFPCGG